MIIASVLFFFREDRTVYQLCSYFYRTTTFYKKVHETQKSKFITYYLQFSLKEGLFSYRPDYYNIVIVIKTTE